MKNEEKLRYEHICCDTKTMTPMERFLIKRAEPPRTLLPGESWTKGEGAVLVLQRGASVTGVTGIGGIALSREYFLGGWCSFRCQLAVPRRFAAREGIRLVEGIQMDDILRGKLSELLQALLSQADCQPSMHPAQLKMQLNHQLHEIAQRELMNLGWRVPYCRLEKILITRSKPS